MQALHGNITVDINGELTGPSDANTNIIVDTEPDMRNILAKQESLNKAIIVYIKLKSLRT